jgi:hypothetical protein
MTMTDFPEGTLPDKVPALVLALAQKAATERVPNPIPLKWRDEGDTIYIQFEDGRALNFDKWERPEPKKPEVKNDITDSNWHALVAESETKSRRKEKRRED